MLLCCTIIHDAIGRARNDINVDKRHGPFEGEQSEGAHISKYLRCTLGKFCALTLEVRVEKRNEVTTVEFVSR